LALPFFPRERTNERKTVSAAFLRRPRSLIIIIRGCFRRASFILLFVNNTLYFSEDEGERSSSVFYPFFSGAKKACHFPTGNSRRKHDLQFRTLFIYRSAAS